MSLVDSDGTASDPAVVLRGEDVLTENGGTAACGSGIMLAAVTSREVENAGLVYTLQTPVLSLQPDLVLTETGILHQGTLYAGNDIVTSAYPESRGITGSGGFTMTIHTEDGTQVASEPFPDQDSASIHWTVPAAYAGEPLYLTVMPLAGADQNTADNTVLLDNVVQEAALRKLTHAGTVDGKDAFLVTVENNGLTDLQDVRVNLKLLSMDAYDLENVGQTKDQLLTTLVVESLEAGEARTVLLTADEPLDLSGERNLMAELKQSQPQ